MQGISKSRYRLLSDQLNILHNWIKVSKRLLMHAVGEMHVGHKLNKKYGFKSNKKSEEHIKEIKIFD